MSQVGRIDWEGPRVRFTIPEVPPSVNHYKKPIYLPGGVRSFARTEEAEAFRELTMIYRRGQTLLPPEWAIWDSKQRRKWSEGVRYMLYARVVLGASQRGDGDNFWKCIGDSLVAAGVIHSDARVRRWTLDVDDEDRGNPRTEIRVAMYRRRSDRSKPARKTAKNPQTA
jgi:hypothetical protein